MEPELILHWKARSYLTLKDDLLLHGNRIVVPTSLRKETLEKVHAGYISRHRTLLTETQVFGLVAWIELLNK